MRVTVAICTWNRAALLDQTFGRLQCLRIPDGVTWELIVVNNNSTDDTEAVIARHTSKLPLRPLFQPKQGLSNARNCVLDHAEGSLLLWTDDDVLVDPDWLASAVDTFMRYGANAAAVGGPVEPWFLVEAEPALLEAFPILRMGFCGVEHGTEECTLADHQEILGANMAFRMDAIRGLRFNPQLGRNGNWQGMGEDSEYVRRLRQRGGTVYWSPKMRLKHYVDPKCMTLEYLTKFYEAMGETAVRESGTSAVVPTIRGYPRWLVRRYLAAYAHWLVRRVTRGRKRALASLREVCYLRGMLNGHRALQASLTGADK